VPVTGRHDERVGLDSTEDTMISSDTTIDRPLAVSHLADVATSPIDDLRSMTGGVLEAAVLRVLTESRQPINTVNSGYNGQR
jgi:hypothetical protein